MMHVCAKDALLSWPLYIVSPWRLARINKDVLGGNGNKKPWGVGKLLWVPGLPHWFVLFPGMHVASGNLTSSNRGRTKTPEVPKSGEEAPPPPATEPNKLAPSQTSRSVPSETLFTVCCSARLPSILVSTRCEGYFPVFQWRQIVWPQSRPLIWFTFCLLAVCLDVFFLIYQHESLKKINIQI